MRAPQGIELLPRPVRRNYLTIVDDQDRGGVRRHDAGEKRILPRAITGKPDRYFGARRRPPPSG